MPLTVLLAPTHAIKIKYFKSPCKAQYDISASYLEKRWLRRLMETQEVKWLFQNCRGSEVKLGAEFRFLCPSLCQVVQVGARSWVSRSCWAPYRLEKKKKVSSWITSTGFCSTLLFIFDFSCMFRSGSRLPGWGLFAEVAELQEKLLLSFTEVSTILAIRKTRKSQITTESPITYAAIPQINVSGRNMMSCCPSTP